MNLLATLLAQAAESRPGEVVIATDRPVLVVGAQGAATLGESLAGDAVFDALAEVLTSEQQADLALGEAVKFDLLVGEATWHLVGETASEVTSVRARPGADAFEPADSVPIPIEPDEPEALLDVPRIHRRQPSGPGDMEFEIPLDDEAAHEERVHVRIAALRPMSADAEPRTAWPRQAVGGGAAWSRNEPARPRRASPATQASLRAAPSALPDDLEALALALASGCFGFLHRASGEALLGALGWPALRIAEGDAPGSCHARLAGLPDATALLVELEDPSPWLPWLLRRVEEGRRALIETSATTPAGARRILLGVHATPRAEAWLDSVPVVHAAVVDGRWVVLSRGT